jgi:hypothetical protein
VALVVEAESPGSPVAHDVDLVPAAVVESAVGGAKPEGPAAEVEVQVQEPFEQLEGEEVTLPRKRSKSS